MEKWEGDERERDDWRGEKKVSKEWEGALGEKVNCLFENGDEAFFFGFFLEKSKGKKKKEREGERTDS